MRGVNLNKVAECLRELGLDARVAWEHEDEEGEPVVYPWQGRTGHVTYGRAKPVVVIQSPCQEKH